MPILRHVRPSQFECWVCGVIADYAIEFQTPPDRRPYIKDSRLLTLAFCHKHKAETTNDLIALCEQLIS